MKSTLWYVARSAEIFVGLVYLVAAVLKAQDINLFIGQILAYQVFTSPGPLVAVALGTLAVETFLGGAMVLGLRWRPLVLGLGVAVLIFFSLLIVYAWQVHGLKDCGCFGAISFTPPQAIGKNVVLIGLTALAWYGLVRRAGGAATSRWHGARLGVPIAAAVIACVVAIPQLGSTGARAPGTGHGAEAASPEGAAPHRSDGPFAAFTVTNSFGETLDLGRGEYLVALLSMTCDHCMESVPQLNAYLSESALPPLVALCLEPEAGSLDQFASMTSPMFPMHSIGKDMLAWSRICPGVPPRLSYVRDGVELTAWTDTMPDFQTLVDGIAAAAPE